jgi:hypothetical protein
MSANTTQPPGMELPNMRELESTYANQRDEYNTLINDAIERGARESITAIQDLNVAMSETLAKMMAILDTTTQQTNDIVFYRTKLEEQLLQIQRDYNLLKSNTDEIETLRRIRQYEETKATTSLNLYMIGLALLCIVLVFVIFVFGRYRSVDATYAIPSPATMMPALT